MALYEIPTGYGTDSLQSDITRFVTLDDISYDFRFRWNSRDESWMLYCSINGGDTIFSTKICSFRILNSAYKYREDCPQGDLFVADMSTDAGRVGFESFTKGGRFRLYYYTAD